LKNTDVGYDAIPDIHVENDAADVDTDYDIDYMDHDCSNPHSPYDHDHERVLVADVGM